MDIRQIIREELQKLMVEKKFDLGATMKVDDLVGNKSGVGGSETAPLRHRQIQQSTETAPEKGEKADGMLTGKEIMASAPSGYYHGSPMSNLTKDNVRLFSKASDAGHAGGGDRYGFYITTNPVTAAGYSVAWLVGHNRPRELDKIGYNIVEEMKKKSLKSQGEVVDDDVYGAPYSLIEDFARKQGFDDGDIYQLRDGSKSDWTLFSILGAIKKGNFPAMYKIKLRPEDRYIPALDVDITHDEVMKYTKGGVVGVYSGKLSGGESKQDQIAILNRHAIASMEKISEEEYYNSKYMEETGAVWLFARDLLSKYK